MDKIYKLHHIDLDAGVYWLIYFKHLEFAEKYLEEGRILIDKDPVQASEKLYKAAEECVKALAIYSNLIEVLEKVKGRDRWTVTELEKAVLKVSEKLGEWFRTSWDAAWALHVWGFHEGRFDSEDVKARLSSIERMVKETVSIITHH
jgi:hypothetical protein